MSTLQAPIAQYLAFGSQLTGTLPLTAWRVPEDPNCPLGAGPCIPLMSVSSSGICVPRPMQTLALTYGYTFFATCITNRVILSGDSGVPFQSDLAVTNGTLIQVRCLWCVCSHSHTVCTQIGASGAGPLVNGCISVGGNLTLQFGSEPGNANVSVLTSLSCGVSGTFDTLQIDQTYASKCSPLTVRGFECQVSHAQGSLAYQASSVVLLVDPRAKCGSGFPTKWVVVGAVLGALLVCMLVIGTIYCCRRRGAIRKTSLLCAAAEDEDKDTITV